jgi:FkbH-like protein
MIKEFDAIADLTADLGFDQSQTVSLLWSLHADLLRAPATPLKLLFVGDCLFVETRAFVSSVARRAGLDVDIRHVFFSAHQFADGANEAIQNEVARYKPNLIGISLYSFEGVPPYAAAWREAALPSLRRRSPRADDLVELLRRTIEDIRKITDAPIVVHTPGGIPLDPLRRRMTFLPAHSRGQKRLLSSMATCVTDLVAGTVNTILLNERDLVRELGARKAASPLFDESDVPSGYAHSTAFGPRVGKQYVEILEDLAVLGGAKALLVDFDNTLWRGVMAEGQVQHDLRAQRLLLQLRQAGVVLVALSKNDQSTIRWEEMVLEESDFALLKIDWAPKPDNVAAAIAELDLAASAFVLLDDNPVERALVSEQVPGVATLDSDRDETWRALSRWLEFPSTTLTAEAARRTEMYRAAAARRAVVSKSHDYSQMMMSLKLKYVVRAATQKDAERVLELVHRTNQFNTTTIRYSTAEVARMVEDSSIGLYVASLSDRFGDLGVVAVGVFNRQSDSVDLVAMSCRAMGFGLEVALLAKIVETEPAASITGRFTATDRNHPASDLFERAGFRRSNDDVWILSRSDMPPRAPSWLEMEA